PHDGRRAEVHEQVDFGRDDGALLPGAHNLGQVLPHSRREEDHLGGFKPLEVSGTQVEVDAERAQVLVDGAQLFGALLVPGGDDGSSARQGVNESEITLAEAPDGDPSPGQLHTLLPPSYEPVPLRRAWYPPGYARPDRPVPRRSFGS